jgi:hypothetical protein
VPRFESSPWHYNQILPNISNVLYWCWIRASGDVILRLEQANDIRGFYALSPSDVCCLASSSAKRVLRADRAATSRRIT